MGDVVKSTLRAVTEALQIPTIIILLLLIAITIFLLGSILVEVFADRRHLKASIPKVIDEIGRAHV